MTDPLWVAAFAALLIGGALLALMRGRDLWPFSPYSMFSRRHDPAEVYVFRLAFERDGQPPALWAPHFYYESMYLSARIAAILGDHTLDHADKQRALVTLVLGALSFARRDDPTLDLGAVTHAVILHRRLDDASGPRFTVVDAPVLRVPVDCRG